MSFIKDYIASLACLSVLLVVFGYTKYVEIELLKNYDSTTEFWSSKKARIEAGKDAFMKPDGFIEYYNSVSKKIGQKQSDYVDGYRFIELSKSGKNFSQARNASFSADFLSRGPGNVGGRTRAIAVDPGDESHCTWIAGAASGGIWRTTDCGDSWTNISPGIPNLSTNSIAQAASNPDVIYVGTGEVFAGNTTFVRGDGIYKSIDRGENWSLLASTVSNNDYQSVNRIAVDPVDENIVVIATNEGIYRTTDGGLSWIQTLDPVSGGSVQDLQVNPKDFNVQYAGVNSTGVFKSTDAGNSWVESSNGISEGVRYELAVAPSQPNMLYTSTYVGESTILYYSDDSAENWVLVDDPSYNTDFLGAQGWYDNTVEVNPYNPYEVFVGGVSIGKYVIDPENVGETERQFTGVDIEGTSFIDFVNYGSDFNGGALDISSGDNSPSTDPVTVEIRFGGDNSQLAHRFTVPAGSTSGVEVGDYAYQDYIEVPFEVWDIENNRQLMVSFRDQEANGVFNLNKRSETSDDLASAREYFYVHDLEYSTNQDLNVAVNGGVEYENMYYFWPVLAENATWDPSSFQSALVRINYGTQYVAPAEAVAVYDAYNNYEGQNTNTVHPDHHHLTFIKIDDANETFMIINGNDGGFSLSRNNGETMNQITDGYVTSQFYGADKKPGEDKYIGGTQDNGTWVSTGSIVDETNAYNFVIGGDGFEVLWHPNESELVLGSIYNNRIRKSTNGGQSFAASANGIAVDDGPFITRLAGSIQSPNTVFAIGESGVYKSTNFGSTWTMKSIGHPGWGGNASASDVEVSLANSDIVWAGAGMAESLNLFVSSDAGESYDVVNNYSPSPEAYYTGIYTHPTDENTAYALFSVADSPKILRTNNLGQNWEDISGFEGNDGVSDRGFPDVFVHSLLVMPFNTNIIWAGTEIGLYESLDGGQSWNIRNGIPSVSIWSMKIVDDQVVLGTHGRGIWTATVSELALSNLKVEAFSYLGYGDADIQIDLPVSYESVKVYINDVEVSSIDAPELGNNLVSISDFYEFEGAEIDVVGLIGSEEYVSKSFTTAKIDVAPEIFNVETSKEGDIYPVTLQVENNEPFEKVEVWFNQQLVYTDEQVLSKTDEIREINFNYEEQGNSRLQLKAYINGDVYITNANTNIITANDESLDSNIRVYPNPTSSYISISSTTIDVKEVKIYGSKGVQVKSIIINAGAKTTQIDLTSISRGVYLIQILGQEGTMFTKRIIKK
jgi:photosystem II stability/assembly factor-like uncharacterized protein